MVKTAGTFQVDLGAVINLLSRNLYSSPGVYLRELVQNSYDAISAREEYESLPISRQITISPVSVASYNAEKHEITIQDAGIGLTADDVVILLATVGATSKKSDITADRRTYLGQFGIGLLSCFLIADEITVISQHANGSPPIRWVGRADGTYATEILNENIRIGTTVKLTPKPDMFGWARPEQVIPLLRKYAEFLPAQILVGTRNGETEISAEPPYLRFGNHRAAILAGTAPIYGGIGCGKQFDAINLNAPNLGLTGVAYIGSRANRQSGAGNNRVYVGGMLVSDSDASLLPTWATFAWAVVDGLMLEPTASREAVTGNQALTEARTYIGQQILGWITELAQTDSIRFEEFVHEYRKDLLAALTNAYDESHIELMRTILPKLVVETTQGEYYIGDLINLSHQVLYANTVDEFRSIAAFNPRGRLIVNAGYTGVSELLHAIPIIYPEVSIKRVFPAAEASLLQAPPADQTDLAFRLQQRAQTSLAQTETEVAVRRLPSADLPGIYVGRGGVAVTLGSNSRANYLVLNWDNKVIRALAEIPDDIVFERIVTVLYVQARMAGNADTPTDRQLLVGALDDIIALAVGVPD